MLFAIDIDGVVARRTHGTAYYVNRVLSLGIPHAEIENIPSSAAFLSLPVVKAYSAQFPDQFKAALDQAQYEAEAQERDLPMEGGVEAVNSLAEQGNIIYITNRKSTTADVTTAWLSRFGYPTAPLRCCGEEKGFISKWLYAGEYLKEDAQLVFIDDMALQLERGIIHLAKENREVTAFLLPRIALLAFGKTIVHPCPFLRPLFPIAVLPSWQQLATTLETVAPFIGLGSKRLACLLEETAPVVLIRIIDPRLLEQEKVAS